MLHFRRHLVAYIASKARIAEGPVLDHDFCCAGWSDGIAIMVSRSFLFWSPIDDDWSFVVVDLRRLRPSKKHERLLFLGTKLRRPYRFQLPTCANSLDIYLYLRAYDRRRFPYVRAEKDVKTSSDRYTPLSLFMLRIVQAMPWIRLKGTHTA